MHSASAIQSLKRALALCGVLGVLLVCLLLVLHFRDRSSRLVSLEEPAAILESAGGSQGQDSSLTRLSSRAAEVKVAPRQAGLNQFAPREAERNVPTQRSGEQLKPYDFALLTRARYDGDVPTEKDIRAIFESEPTDHKWAPRATARLHLQVDGMPERSAVGDVNIECRTTLCRVRVEGVQEQLQPVPGGLGIQGSLIALAAQAPVNEEFDNFSAYYTFDQSTGAAEFRQYFHRPDSDQSD